MKLRGFSPLAQKAKRLALTLAKRGGTLCISWCPSHCGIPGNDLADAVAKKGLSKPPSTEAWTSMSHIYRRATASTIDKWKTDWATKDARNHSGLGRVYRRICQDSLQFRTRATAFDFGRQWPIYTQLKTGIGPFKSHLFLIRKADSPVCSCGRRQTGIHLLLSCPLFSEERKVLRKDIAPLSLPVVFCTDKGKKTLRAFLEATGLGEIQEG